MLRTLVLALSVVGLVATANAELIQCSKSFPTVTGSTPYTIGDKIQIGSSPITINALGVQDTGAVGITGNVPVGLWNAAGTTLYATAIVPSGTAGTLLNGYYYTAATFSNGFTGTLAANTQYLIGAVSTTGGAYETAGEGFGYPAGQQSIYSGTAGVTIVSSNYGAKSTTLTAPTTVGGTGATVGRWGSANATFLVPEPSSVVLLVMSVFGLLAYAWRKRK